MLVISYFILGASSVAHSAANYTDAKAIFGIGQVMGIVVACLALMRYTSLRTMQHVLVFNQLVSDNGWTHLKQLQARKIAGMLVAHGNYEILLPFRAKRKGRTYECSIFEFVTNLDERSPTRRFICMHTRLTKAFPTIVLDNKYNYFDHGHRSDLTERIPGGVALSLEGDFSDHYDVSTTKGSEREATEVMSPDLMAVFADAADQKIDVEINDKDLFLMCKADFYSEQNLTALFDTADTAVYKLDRLSKTWMASSKEEAEDIKQTARETRQKFLMRPFHIGIGFVLTTLALTAFTILLLYKD